MKKIAVLFSGGLDSTTLAAKLCPDFDEVHLLTQIVPLSLFNKLALRNAGKLRKNYGDKIVHRFLDSRKTIGAIRGDFLRVLSDNKKFGFYYSWCLGCKIGMHAATIKYCIEHDIHQAADGNNNAQAGHALEQTQDFVAEMKDIYRLHGIDYSCALYDQYKKPKSRGWIYSVLERAELIDHKKTQREEFKKAGYVVGLHFGHQHRTIQPQCFFALALNLLRLFLSQFREEKPGCAINYLRDKREIFEKAIMNGKITEGQGRA